MNATNENTDDTQNEGRQPQKITRVLSLKALCESTYDYFSTAKQKIQIYTRNLDPRVLNSRELEQSLSRFIRSSRFVKVEILITEERNLQGIDHRLVSLAQKYTSFVSIKVIPKDYHENHFAFYLIDGRTLIYRNVADRYESEIHQLPSSHLKQKTKYFDEVWEKSSPAIHLRALHL
ncbi:hypothetical protein [Aliikangiella coralliicola]|uniref:DUF7931 domain-containing protein n=1 Tax=Aliikangiella coralliicola TaxID=2592383 RepID=A0A545U4Q7_9GAMM|nr:hypothetical protein [Aliikangiella coralliicola]TQV84442.1 hypothetical protein FLL46_22765 [Aliikangiella coralliicola]